MIENFLTVTEVLFIFPSLESDFVIDLKLKTWNHFFFRNKYWKKFKISAEKISQRIRSDLRPRPSNFTPARASFSQWKPCLKTSKPNYLAIIDTIHTKTAYNSTNRGKKHKEHSLRRQKKKLHRYCVIRLKPKVEFHWPLRKTLASYVNKIFCPPS